MFSSENHATSQAMRGEHSWRPSHRRAKPSLRPSRGRAMFQSLLHSRLACFHVVAIPSPLFFTWSYRPSPIVSHRFRRRGFDTLYTTFTNLAFIISGVAVGIGLGAALNTATSREVRMLRLAHTKLMPSYRFSTISLPQEEVGFAQGIASRLFDFLMPLCR